jgi:hypothetical protein
MHDDDPVDEPVAALRAVSWPGLTASPAAPSIQPWHSFPRGALAGNFVHDQLEWLAHEGFALQDAPDLQQQLQRRCERQGWQARAPELQAWLTEAVATPLPPLGSSLRGVKKAMPEMEFWLPSAGLVAADVDALCQQHILPGLARPALPERELRGMLMGFADLVFEQGGRYWVLDYKSNHLGDSGRRLHRQTRWTRPWLRTATTCRPRSTCWPLHRLLRARLGAAYTPQQHLGGRCSGSCAGSTRPQAGLCHLTLPGRCPLLDALERCHAGPVAAPARERRMNKPGAAAPTLLALQRWVDAGWLRHLDRALAPLGGRARPPGPPRVADGHGAAGAPGRAAATPACRWMPWCANAAALLAWLAPAPQAPLAQAWHRCRRAWTIGCRPCAAARWCTRRAEWRQTRASRWCWGGSATAPLLYLRRYWGYEHPRGAGAACSGPVHPAAGR